MNKLRKVVVVGGTGLIGSKVCSILEEHGISVIAASPSTGVDTITGEGLAKATHGTDAVIDVSNAPNDSSITPLDFFTQSTSNLVTAAARGGARHYIVLSIVGVDRMPDNGYFQAKLAQERIVAAPCLPYTIVRATQFMEFLASIADAYTSSGAIALPVGQFQPVAADDVAEALADIVNQPALTGIVEFAGPERGPFDLVMARYLRMRGDTRQVTRNPGVEYFGGHVGDFSLVPTGAHLIGKRDLETWVRGLHHA